MISVISGDNVALLTGRILAAFGRPEDIPVGHNDPDRSVRASMRLPERRSLGAARIAIPNLGMMLPTECNVWINFRLMVRFVSMMKLIG